MTIPIHQEPDIGSPHEKCCFCRTPTPYWTSLDTRKPGEQVACCQPCSKRGDEIDVPSKKVWCRRERIACGD